MLFVSGTSDTERDRFRSVKAFRLECRAYDKQAWPIKRETTAIAG